MPITVLVADRQASRLPPYLHRLRHEDGIRVVGDARSGAEIVAVTSALKPRVLLLADGIGRRDLAVLLALVRRKSHRTRVIILGQAPSSRQLVDAAAHGARGWVDDAAAPALVSEAVRAVAGGQAWLPRGVVSNILARLQAKAPARNLGAGGAVGRVNHRPMERRPGAR